jgi:hypothetical protein
MDLGGPQAVKVLSPEILFLRDSAEVLFITEGNTLESQGGERMRRLVPDGVASSST